MPSVRNIGGKVRYSIERFDGGYNTKESPSKISAYESPDCLNVVFDDQGAVGTRDGSVKFNTTAVGSFTVDHGLSYNGNMIAWSNGTMYTTSGSVSGTTFLPVTTSSGRFGSGSHVAAQVYQNVLFCSDGSLGPWKYTGGESFYNMGIDIPSSVTGSGTSAGLVSPSTYYYAVSFINSQVVEGEIGSASVGVIVAASAVVGLTSIPVGSGLAGVNTRFVYRSDSSAGPFRKVGEIANNTTTTFADNIAPGAEGKLPIEDATSPEPFKTIELAKERLFMDSTEDGGASRSFGRWTDYQNPYVSAVENFEAFSRGDGEDVIAIGAQEDFVTFFKDNRSFSLQIVDPADDLTWVRRDISANLGIVGPKALTKVQGGIIFVGRQHNRLTGFHFLSGIDVQSTTDGQLRSLSISEKIEYDLLNLLSMNTWDDVYLSVFENRLFMAHARESGTRNTHLFWLDLNRIGTKGQVGSWAPWDGINAKCIFEHNGALYAGDSTSTGFVRQFNSGVYSDSGTAINSYFWTKAIGGQEEGELDSYVKDLRELYVWHEKLGNYNMSVRYRVDGDSGSGTSYNINLNNEGSTWDDMVWDVGEWDGNLTDSEARIVVGRTIGKRFQIRFDNQNTVNQGFKIFRLELGMNLRRRR